MEIRRVGVQEGYDIWSDSYESTPNPVVAVDSRHTLPLLAPQKGQRILDAGCGTGRNLRPMLLAGADVFGIDFSLGMLRVAQTNRIAQADLLCPLPFQADTFDAVLCALIGEHLPELNTPLHDFFRITRPGGRLVFSVYHPELAAAGKEANFQKHGAEYRLGAVVYSTHDYLRAVADAGYVSLAVHEFQGDDDRNMILAITAEK